MNAEQIKIIEDRFDGKWLRDPKSWCEFEDGKGHMIKSSNVPFYPSIFGVHFPAPLPRYTLWELYGANGARTPQDHFGFYGIEKIFILEISNNEEWLVNTGCSNYIRFAIRVERVKDHSTPRPFLNPVFDN